MSQLFVHSRPRAAGAIGALRRRFDTLFRLHRGFRQWRWRGARPFAHLNDHLRRDIGLPPADTPFDPGRPCW